MPDCSRAVRLRLPCIDQAFVITGACDHMGAACPRPTNDVKRFATASSPLLHGVRRILLYGRTLASPQILTKAASAIAWNLHNHSPDCWHTIMGSRGLASSQHFAGRWPHITTFFRTAQAALTCCTSATAAFSRASPCTTLWKATCLKVVSARYKLCLFHEFSGVQQQDRSICMSQSHPAHGGTLDIR